MPYALDDAARELGALIEALSRERTSLPGFAAGSPAAAEQEELGGLGGYVNDLTATCSMRLMVAEDYILAIAGLIPTPAVYSLYPLARSTADLMGRVYWLTDPDLNAKGRARRQLGDRLDSLKEQGFITAVPGLVGQSKKRRSELLTEAGRYGVHPDKPPKWMAANRDVWATPDGVDEDLGTVTYQLLSAFSHGTLYAVTHFVSPVQGHDGHPLSHPTDGLLWGRVETTAAQEAMAVVMCMIPYRAALARWAAWGGFDLLGPLLRLHEVMAPFRALLDDPEDDAS